VRIVYLGTPDDSVPPLRALVDAGHDIAMVVTQPDRRRSRGAGTDPSPVRRAADELGLTVRTPDKAREIVDEVRASGAELGVVVGGGPQLPGAGVDAWARGGVKQHNSFVARRRGAAPVERAILAGDDVTGVCLMQLEAGLDTGPVFAAREVAIEPHDTAGALRARLVEAGTQLLVDNLPTIGECTPVPQSGEPTYAEKLTVEEFRLDPARPAPELERIVRAGNPRPGAWMPIGGKRVKVWQARAVEAADAPCEPGVITPASELCTASGALALEEVQPEGKRVMAASAWRTGLRADAKVDA
jgi:methionyl-tRNA formyltransferase